MHTLKAGTTLYHGTDNHNFEEDSSSLDAYSWVSTSRTVAEWFATRESWGGPKRVIEYRLSEDLSLPEITSSREMQLFAEEHSIDLGSTEDIRDSARAAGISGWIIPSNYQDGDDIFIAGAHMLEYVGTSLLETPRPPAPSVDSLLQMAEKLDACSSVLHGSAYTPVRTTERLLRHLARQGMTPREVDGFANLIKDLRRFANTVANPARERMQAAAAMLENLNDAGVCS